MVFVSWQGTTLKFGQRQGQGQSTPKFVEDPPKPVQCNNRVQGDISPQGGSQLAPINPGTRGVQRKSRPRTAWKAFVGRTKAW
ncbi:hypothetical protein M569_17519 [Genlisea aurea]|uniref:Uncharacterized protein n=1 Tax=Genlisea aurea TaxID=192259 RepID=S8BRQ2_9LAMI|nr:hypothetical protein M569_17519 [Genlisea aurea]